MLTFSIWSRGWQGTAQVAYSRASLPPPLENILGDIRASLDARLYYPALLMALTLPEICAGLALDDCVQVGMRHYVAFLEKYTDQEPTPALGVSSIECYQLRGGLVHRGNAASHKLMPYYQVCFTTDESQIQMHSVSEDGPLALFLSLRTFCEVLDEAVRRWFADHATDSKVIENLPRLISRRVFDSAFFGPVSVVGSGNFIFGQTRLKPVR